MWIQTASKGKVGQKQTIKIIYAEPGQLYVTVASPSGWTKQIQTDEQGNAEFVPLWPGTYYIEASKSWKETGQLHGKEYSAFWRCATTLVDVAK